MLIYEGKVNSKDLEVAYYYGMYAFVCGELKAILRFGQIDINAIYDILDCFNMPKYVMVDIVVRLIDISTSNISMPAKLYLSDDIYIKCNAYLVTPWKEIKLVGMTGDSFYNEISYIISEFYDNIDEFILKCFNTLTPYLGVGDLDGGRSFVKYLS